ncbi:hypothetical protein Syn7502_02143 [Synechococcus sp. PCC 7502]|nr:hypothetical protein Syn7502_02143 [Synechococcus sp. PCC 7502]
MPIPMVLISQNLLNGFGLLLKIILQQFLVKPTTRKGSQGLAPYWFWHFIYSTTDQNFAVILSRNFYSSDRSFYLVIDEGTADFDHWMRQKER